MVMVQGKFKSLVPPGGKLLDYQPYVWFYGKEDGLKIVRRVQDHYLKFKSVSANVRQVLIKRELEYRGLLPSGLPTPYFKFRLKDRWWPVDPKTPRPSYRGMFDLQLEVI